MKIMLYLNKSVEENASMYFDKAKKAKKKLEGATKALAESKKKLEEWEKKQALEEKKKKDDKTKRKKEWFEKFRWFYTSSGLQVLAGRDATSNEIVIKKHTDPEDLVFHTDMAGSPFGVIKAQGEIDEDSIKETAQFIASYSKAWKLGLSRMDVFYVNPDQVSKTPPSGEFIQKGSFMIYGKKNSVSVLLKLFIGKMKDGKIMAGPEAAVKTYCEKYVEIIQGNDKTTQLAKKIMHEIEADDLDDIVRVIPPGSKLK